MLGVVLVMINENRLESRQTRLSMIMHAVGSNFLLIVILPTGLNLSSGLQ